MSEYTAGSWEHRRNPDGTFCVFPKWHKKSTLANVIARGMSAATTEANARLIASAPAMHHALSGAVEALRGTEALLRNMGMDTASLKEIVSAIDGLLDSVDRPEVSR